MDFQVGLLSEGTAGQWQQSFCSKPLSLHVKVTAPYGQRAKRKGSVVEPTAGEALLGNQKTIE
jgi:hypothetical protein